MHKTSSSHENFHHLLWLWNLNLFYAFNYNIHMFWLLLAWHFNHQYQNYFTRIFTPLPAWHFNLL